MSRQSARTLALKYVRDIQWKSDELLITPEGLERFKENHQEDMNSTGLYMHLDYKTRKIIRIGIGIGQNGVYGRWFMDSGCHYSVIMRQNSQRHEAKYPDYYSFFSQLGGMSTILAWSNIDAEEAKGVEKFLIYSFEPVWERFRDLFFGGHSPIVKSILESEYGYALAEDFAVCR